MTPYKFFMEWYLLMFSDEKKAVEYAWGIMVCLFPCSDLLGSLTVC